jgi:hypothetical protein
MMNQYLKSTLNVDSHCRDNEQKLNNDGMTEGLNKLTQNVHGDFMVVA